MTDALDDLDPVLASYRGDPIDNGDLVLITDQRLVQELAGFADVWAPHVRRAVADLLRATRATDVVVAIARPDDELLLQDALWADLRAELEGSGIRLRPPVPLPARDGRRASA
ncbi:MAG: hypothetical protein QOJ48_840 [Frankiales bacterium]|nr:hypothetical protein [Frankiales bacterium]